MINILKGTKDVLPQESYKWQKIEHEIEAVTRLYNLHRISTPTFEHTELFLRGVGDTTDIVNKEMYTFEDRGGRSISLKPEGTAGVVRSYIENSLSQLPQPLKMYYETPVFRYERPQAGRLREHHQFGVEIYGADSPAQDVEVMLIAKTLFERLGISGLELRINSIGCPTCRKAYNAALKSYFASRVDELCATCRERLDKNPLRILDCKEEKCGEIAKNAPSVLDYLCEDCRAHHEGVKALLTKLGISYVVDDKIVRGLDYYTKTVFEFVAGGIGAKSTVCGGGRYNGLVEQIGGKPCPAVGFGMGIERLILTMTTIGASFGEEPTPDLFLANIGLPDEAFLLAESLRKEGIAAECDTMGRSLKSQMKLSDKLGAKYVVVIGESEWAAGVVKVKEMKSGEEEECSLANIANYIKEKKA
ncbi:MAG: histidine--tRNA ligase [Clostridia bacterium]|nr:histidine--tRNA ligase [Clostridia bacterium]